MVLSRGLLGAGLLLAAVAGAGPALADPLAGSWRGSGYVQPSSSARERVTCRITYTKQTAKVYKVSARCASKSESIRQSGEVLKVSETRYVGDFYNPQFDVSGRVKVTVNGSKQTVTFSGKAGRGTLTLSKR